VRHTETTPPAANSAPLQGQNHCCSAGALNRSHSSAGAVGGLALAAAASNLPALNDAQALKLKQLTVVSLAEGASMLPYETLMSQLEVPTVRQLEDLLINDCMYTGIVRGKLDQQKRCLEVRLPSEGAGASFDRGDQLTRTGTGRRRYTTPRVVTSGRGSWTRCWQRSRAGTRARSSHEARR
jgi:hypothetical protein